jgi:hypothetical protein
LNWPETKLVFTLGSILLIVMIVMVVFQIRPLYRHVEEIQKALERYVLPRHLTAEQISKIADFLSKHSPQKVKIQQPLHDEEASSYRCDFQNAITRGGWQLAGIDTSENIQEGVTIDIQQPMPDPQNPPDKKSPNPSEVLQQAFRHAKVRISGSSGGHGRNTQETTLTLRIGKRRMDDGELRARQEDLERLRKLQQNPDDFDI